MIVFRSKHSTHHRGRHASLLGRAEENTGRRARLTEHGGRSRLVRVGVLISALSLAIGLAPAAHAESGVTLISGSVTVPDAADPLTGYVALHAWLDDRLEATPATYVYIDDGSFSSSVTPGVYGIEFVPMSQSAAHLIPQWVGDEGDMTSDPNEAAPVTILAGEDNVVNGDLAATGWVITGTIKDPHESPLKNACVALAPAPDSPADLATLVWPTASYLSCTDADGQYVSQAVPDGDYYLFAGGWSANYGTPGGISFENRWYSASDDGQPAAIHVSGENVNGIDLTLQPEGEKGEVAVTLTASSGDLTNDVFLAVIGVPETTPHGVVEKLQSGSDLDGTVVRSIRLDYGDYQAIAFDTSGHFATSEPVEFTLTPENSASSPLDVSIDMGVADAPGTPYQAERSRLHVGPTGEVHVSWQAPDTTSNIDHYTITAQPTECAQDRGCYPVLTPYRQGPRDVAQFFGPLDDGAKVGTALNDETSGKVGGLLPGVSYRIFVAAVDAEGKAGVPLLASEGVYGVASIDPDSAVNKSFDGSEPGIPVKFLEKPSTEGDNFSAPAVSAEVTGKGSVTVAPVQKPADSDTPTIHLTDSVGTFVDLSVSVDDSDPDKISSVTPTLTGLGAKSTGLQWWDSSAEPGQWKPVLDENGDPVVVTGGSVTFTINERTSPSINDLTGTIFAATKDPAPDTDSSGPAGPTDDGSAPSAAAPSSSPVTNGRVAGENRFETAATVALQFAAADPEFAGNVVIANAEAHKNGFDALSANALAGSLHAPLLLTGRDTLPASTRAAIVALLEGHSGATIVVMGAADSVSDAVVVQIREAAKAAGVAVTITRVAGSNRYATSARAALKAGTPASVALTEGGPKLPTAFLASGAVNADSVAASSASNGLGIPVLLTRSGELPPEIAQAITTLGIRQVVILGGTDRISSAVEAALAPLGVTSIKRVAGADRFDTSVQLYTLARSLFGQDGSVAYLANGHTGWPDALAAGPLAGVTGAPLLTVPVGSLPESVRKFLADNGFTGIVALGKSGTIANSVLDAAQVVVG